mgnify:CR=1 FL=1
MELVIKGIYRHFKGFKCPIIAIAKDFIYTKLNIYRYYIGRPGQSFDPKVRAVRAADDVTKVLKFLLDWVRRNRSIVPLGGTRDAYTEENFQSLATWHYRELAEFSLDIAKPRLKEWDEYLTKNFPEIKPNTTVQWYRRVPTWMFLAGIRLKKIIEKGKRFVKRMRR